MKRISKLFLLTLILLVISTGLFSFLNKEKDWILIKSISTPTIKKVSLDRYYNFYISDNHGNVIKYDTLGNETLRYSPQRKSDVSLLEAWKTVNVFLFYRELQEYNLLDRFLTTSSQNFKIKSEIGNETSIGFARIATLSSDNNLWVFDDDDFSLKKFDTRLNRVIYNTSLDLILDPQFYDLNYMREYQNLLFINDRSSGILIFDNLGNYKKTISFRGIEYFNFLGNNLYFIKDSSLVILDVYTGMEKIIALPADQKYQYALMSPGTVFLFSENKVDLFKLSLPIVKE